MMQEIKMSLIDEVQSREAKVDSGITRVQSVLEELKQSPHSAWTLLVIGVVLLLAGVYIWAT